MNNIRRVCLFGGPGAFKSTTAAFLYFQLKCREQSVEIITEFCKSLAYTGTTIQVFDQCFFQGSQLHSEYKFLANGVSTIITDSPVLLSAIYSKHYHFISGLDRPMKEISDIYDANFPPLNIFLDRADKSYSTHGRFESYDEAKNLDALIWFEINKRYVLGENLFKFRYDDRSAILELVLKHITK